MISTKAAFDQAAMPGGHRHDNDNDPFLRNTRPRRQAQSADIRRTLLSEYDDALAVIGRIEAGAGPTLRNELGRSKRVQAIYQTGLDREQFRRRRLGQRSGLLKLLRAELGIDPIITDRAQLYVQHLLEVSANVAGITGSGWPSTRGWFRSRLPTIAKALEIEMERDFSVYLGKARAALTHRMSSGDPRLFVGPTPIEIAEKLQITTAQLASAKANGCSLTSIDAPDRRAQDRKRKERKRREAGMKPQTDRTVVADMQALADRLECSVSTIQRRRRAGTLDAFIASRSTHDQNLSALNVAYDSGHSLVTSSPLGR